MTNQHVDNALGSYEPEQEARHSNYDDLPIITKEFIADKLLEAKVSALVEAAHDIANDLASYIENQYPKENRDRYPSYQRRYENEMGSVINLRNLIRSFQTEGA